MVGNSLKSDIAPALAVGAWAIHIPFHVTWQLEQFAVGSGGAVTRVKDFDHERLFKVESFRDILRFF
jgi:putative hydrolase of the HAD superfamily